MGAQEASENPQEDSKRPPTVAQTGPKRASNRPPRSLPRHPREHPRCPRCPLEQSPPNMLDLHGGGTCRRQLETRAHSGVHLAQKAFRLHRPQQPELHPVYRRAGLRMHQPAVHGVEHVWPSVPVAPLEHLSVEPHDLDRARGGPLRDQGLQVPHGRGPLQRVRKEGGDQRSSGERGPAPGLQPRAPQITWGAEMHPHPRGLAAGVEEKEEGEGPVGVKVRFHPETSSSAVTSSGVTCSHKKFMRATAFSSSDQSPGYSDTPWGVTN